MASNKPSSSSAAPKGPASAASAGASVSSSNDVNDHKTAAGPSSSASSSRAKATVEDGEEDEEEEEEEDLDDLDDVLPTFTQPPAYASGAAASSSNQPSSASAGGSICPSDTNSAFGADANGSGSNPHPRPVSSTAKHIRTLSVGSRGADGDDDGSDLLPTDLSGDPESAAAFEQELMKGMEELLAGLGAGGGADAAAGTSSKAGGGGGKKNFYDAPLEDGAEVGEEEKQLQELFARLMSGGGGGAVGGSGGGKDFDGLMKEIMETAGGAGAPPSTSTTGAAKARGPTSTAASSSSARDGSASTPGAGAGSKPTFDETIRASLKNLNKPAAAPAASGADDPLTALLEQFAASGAGGGMGGMGAGGDQDFGGLLDGMMKQLMTREILEEPLSELAEKYPPYLEEQEKKLRDEQGAATVSREQLDTYRKQHAIVLDILATFRRSDYSDSNDQLKTQVTEKMTAMQDLGSPPEEIMGDMPEGMDFGGEGCNIM